MKMRSLFILPLKKTLPSPLPLSSTTKVRIRIGSFNGRISSEFYASVSARHILVFLASWLIVSILPVHFLEEGQQAPQPPKLQPEQGLIIEAPSKLLYLEQNVDSFEDMCDTYRARRQARDRGLSINTNDITQGLSTGPLFSPAREDAEKTEEDWDDVLYKGWQRVTNLLF